MRVTRNFTNQFPHFHSLGVLHGRGAHDLRAKPAMALDQPQQEQRRCVCARCMHACIHLLLLKHLLRSRRRCTEQEVGCSSQDRAIIELEFVQCLANPHYLNCGCTQWAEGGQASTAKLLHCKPAHARDVSVVARDSCSCSIRAGPEPLL